MRAAIDPRRQNVPTATCTYYCYCAVRCGADVTRPKDVHIALLLISFRLTHKTWSFYNFNEFEP